MTKLTVSCLQMCTVPDVAANNKAIADGVAEAVGKGAQLVSLPEAANILLLDNMRYPRECVFEEEDTTLALCRELARRHGIWMHAGSLLVRQREGSRVWNRTFLIVPDGRIVARYDKLHTFDVALGGGYDFQESAAVAPGKGAIVADIGSTKLGLSICYDLRFAYLFRALAQAGAEILLIPAAFSPATGPVHWEPLLKARAIETGSFVIAAAQTGTHEGDLTSHGHSAIVSPFGEVLAEGGTEPGLITATLELDEVAGMRRRLPCLTQDRDFGTVEVIRA